METPRWGADNQRGERRRAASSRTAAMSFHERITPVRLPHRPARERNTSSYSLNTSAMATSKLTGLNGEDSTSSPSESTTGAGACAPSLLRPPPSFAVHMIKTMPWDRARIQVGTFAGWHAACSARKNMSNYTLNIVSLCLALTGCGGSAFDSAAATDVDGGPVGVGGSAGASDADGGTRPPEGGAGGRLGTVLGTGGVTSGTGGATTGTGGVTGAAGGGDLGGADAGGTPAAGGATGTGGAGATCKPPVVDATNLPQTIVWDSYLSKYGSTCLTCTHGPCATCTVAWWPVTQSADGLTLTAQASVTCGPVDVSLVACGSDPSASSCTTWAAPQISSTLVFSLQPKGDGSGYTVMYRTNNGTQVSSYQGQGGACSKPVFDGAVTANEPMWTLFFALRDAVTATKWPCGS